MSDDEGYAPAAQMLICFIFPACVQKNTDADDRCHLPNGQPESYWSSVELVSRNALVLNGLGTFRVIGKP
jgi:hypothetical protein